MTNIRLVQCVKYITMTMTFSDGCLRIFPNDYPMMEVGESIVVEQTSQNEDEQVDMSPEMENDWDKTLDILMSVLGR